MLRDRRKQAACFTPVDMRETAAVAPWLAGWLSGWLAVGKRTTEAGPAKGQSGHRLNLLATRSQAPPEDVAGDMTSCIAEKECGETVLVNIGVLSKCAFQSMISWRSRIGLEYGGGSSR